ncbi:hypothetical protein FQN50_002376 [Emmonsiellopsis sp. PD_5]|nr:hypothetical protein FQN50_002376 [Emmonsiellopsis sp. PD_5]
MLSGSEPPIASTRCYSEPTFAGRGVCREREAPVTSTGFVQAGHAFTTNFVPVPASRSLPDTRNLPPEAQNCWLALRHGHEGLGKGVISIIVDPDTAYPPPASSKVLELMKNSKASLLFSCVALPIRHYRHGSPTEEIEQAADQGQTNSAHA